MNSPAYADIRGRPAAVVDGVVIDADVEMDLSRVDRMIKFRDVP